MENKYFEIDIDGARFKTILIITDDLSKVYDDIKRKYKKNSRAEKKTQKWGGCVVWKYKYDFKLCYVIVQRENEKISMMRLTHEILHLSEEYLKMHGKHFCSDEEEYCMIDSYLNTIIISILLETNEVFYYDKHEGIEIKSIENF